MESKTDKIMENQSTLVSTLATSSSEISEEKDSEACDSLAMQKILPEEVWLIIIEKLFTKRNGTEDKYAHFEFFNNSSLYFRNLLQPKRVLALFEMVLWVGYPWILATTDDDPGNSSDTDSSSNWKTVDEDSDIESNINGDTELLEQKPISVIKTCREVCSAWNQAVDQLLFEKYIPYTQKGMHSLEKRVLRNMEYEQFDKTFDINKFLNFFKDTHPKISKGTVDRSPFISREVEIHLSRDYLENDEDPGFPKAIELLLDTYSGHIWSLGVYINGRNSDANDQLQRLAEAFNYVKIIPKLKRLAICDYSSYMFGSVDAEILDNGFEFEDSPQYKLPHFPDLVELKTSGLPAPIFNQVIRNNDHVCHLKVDRKPEGNYEIANLPFPNLRTLHLNFWSMEQVDVLENVEMHSIRTLQFSYSNCCDFPDYSRIFAVIGYNWWNTLTNLKLHLPMAQSAEDYRKVLEHTANERLDLPNLQTFNLTIYQPFFLDFILPTRHSLERLTILQINNPTFFRTPLISKRDKRNEIIEFVGVDGRLKRSNIWEFFPRLDYIKTVGCKKVGGFVEEISR